MGDQASHRSDSRNPDAVSKPARSFEVDEAARQGQGGRKSGDAARWLDLSRSPDERTELVLWELTSEEKFALLSVSMAIPFGEIDCRMGRSAPLHTIQ